MTSFDTRPSDRDDADARLRRDLVAGRISAHRPAPATGDGPPEPPNRATRRDGRRRRRWLRRRLPKDVEVLGYDDYLDLVGEINGDLPPEDGTEFDEDYDAAVFADEPEAELEPVAVEDIPRRDPPRRNKLLDRWGWYEVRAEGAWTTTRQAEALNLATTRRSGRARGVLAGLNKRGKSIVIADPFELYGTDLENINVAVIGDIGKAKSSLIKTAYCLRQLLPGRQVVVIDKKLQGVRGEYGPIADALGVRSVVFETGGGGAHLNLLDPAISTGGEHKGGIAGVVPAGQIRLVLAVLEDSVPTPLTTEEIAAVSRGLVHVNDAARRDNREPVISELGDWLLNPVVDSDYFGELWAQDARKWGLRPGLAIKRLVEGDLKGLVDQPTSPEIHEALTKPFVHFDICKLPTDGPAVRVVMTVINTWLANLLAARAAAFQQTLLIVEEGWHTAEGSTGNVFRGNMKLSRGLGLSTVSAFHHISDLPDDSPARALMQEAGIVFLYGQARVADAVQTAEMYHLPAGSADVLMALGKGECLVKIGSSDPIFMQHARSATEVWLTDTDANVTGDTTTAAA